MTTIKDLSDAKLLHSLAACRDCSDVQRLRNELTRTIRELQAQVRELEAQNRELQEAQRALKRSRNRYAELYDGAPIGYVSLNSEGVIRDINMAGATMLGRKRTHLVGSPLRRYVAPEDQSTLLTHLKGCLQQDQAVAELTLLTSTGDRLAVQLASRKTFTHDAEEVRYLTALTDLTERMRTDALQRQWAAIVESSDDAILGKTLDGVITGWNAGAERLFGYAADEAIGRPISFIIPPERQAEDLEILMKIGQGQRVDHYETERLGKDGRRIAISLTVSPLQDEQGRIMGASTIARDITARKAAEQQLKERDAFAKKVLMSSLNGLYIYDVKAGRDVFINAQCTELTGYTLEDLQSLSGKDFFNLFHPDDQGRIIAHFKALLDTANGETLEIEYRIRTADGRWIWCISRDGVFAREADGSVLQIIGTFLDITERKRVEELRLEYDRRKDEFLAMLGHELRNPLMPIRNAVHIQRKFGASEPKLIWACEVIDRQVTQLIRLVDDLLDVSRIVQGKLALKKTLVELAAVIAQAVETARPFVEARRHALTIFIPEDPIQVEGDSVRLVQVVSNLLNNAAKYTSEGGRIWLSLTRENGEAVVSVRDTGEGIPGKLLPHLFTPFTQAERTLDRAQGGLGLGLTIVKRIVELHGGWVEAESGGSGRGSEFIVRLPLYPDV